MGWTFSPEWDTQRLAFEAATKTWNDGETHCMRLNEHRDGFTFYSLHRIEFPDKPSVVFIVVTLTDRSSVGGHEWGYKAMSENVGPCYYAAPIAWLDYLTPPETPYAEAWRDKVREYHYAKAS